MGKLPHVFLTGHPSSGKTTIVKTLQATLDCSFTTRGFYTEECRKGGDRIGFDILHWGQAGSEVPQRHSLSRMVQRIQKGKPHVGKYLVDIDNVKQYAVSSLKSPNASKTQNELIVLDEVGKMEMLCPEFIPAVHDLLNEENSTPSTRILLGTIPTPRYGRVIPTVEDIRARDDVIVVHVTKANRDELKEVLYHAIRAIFSGRDSETDLRAILKPFAYDRAIGASSMNGKGSKESSKSATTTVSTSLVPCGPLFSKSIPPKVLILGETASQLPSNDDYAYCERSMWIVLGRMLGMDYRIIKDVETAPESTLKGFLRLRDKVLAHGICVWDVVADVHEKSRIKKSSKRPKRMAMPNDIDIFLKKHPSIQVIGFIGQKAFSRYKGQKENEIKLVTLPSSSPSNTRLSVDEKAALWKEAMCEAIPEFKR